MAVKGMIHELVDAFEGVSMAEGGQSKFFGVCTALGVYLAGFFGPDRVAWVCLGLLICEQVLVFRFLTICNFADLQNILFKLLIF